jgi:hypothetical protein
VLSTYFVKLIKFDNRKMNFNFLSHQHDERLKLEEWKMKNHELVCSQLTPPPKSDFGPAPDTGLRNGKKGGAFPNTPLGKMAALSPGPDKNGSTPLGKMGGWSGEEKRKEAARIRKKMGANANSNDGKVKRGVSFGADSEDSDSSENNSDSSDDSEESDEPSHAGSGLRKTLWRGEDGNINVEEFARQNQLDVEDVRIRFLGGPKAHENARKKRITIPSRPEPKWGILPNDASGKRLPRVTVNKGNKGKKEKEMRKAKNANGHTPFGTEGDHENEENDNEDKENEDKDEDGNSKSKGPKHTHFIPKGHLSAAGFFGFAKKMEELKAKNKKRKNVKTNKKGRDTVGIAVEGDSSEGEEGETDGESDGDDSKRSEHDGSDHNDTDHLNVTNNEIHNDCGSDTDGEFGLERINTGSSSDVSGCSSSKKAAATGTSCADEMSRSSSANSSTSRRKCRILIVENAIL